MPLRISRVLHAGYVFNSETTQILFDPIFENPFSRNCHAFPDVRFDLSLLSQQKFDAVFISHYHDDHCSFESLKRLNRETPIYMYCLHHEMFDWLKMLGFKNVTPLRLGQSVSIGDLHVSPIRALDVDVDCIFHINHGELNVLNVVDSWIDHEVVDELSQIKWDCILWPFQTMREIEILSPSRAKISDRKIPPEWREQLKQLKPLHLISSSCQFKMESWSWQNFFFFPISYKSFNEQIVEILPETQVIRLNPSEAIQLRFAEPALRVEPIAWVHPVGDQNLDYIYLPHLDVPKTSEVAQNFPELDPEQKQFVLNYCHQGIITRYQNVMSSTEKEQKERIWQLSLYEKTGKEIKFQYMMKGPKIQPVLKHVTEIEWLTELPLYKLYTALTEGESLSSLYIRVNDCQFSEAREKELELEDVLRDPLICCLFDNEFCAFQKAQLNRIISNQS